MSENKNVQTKNENTEGKFKISEKNLAIVITAAILAVVAIAAAIVFVIQAVKSDSGFDYLKSDLEKYIEFTDDYKSFAVSLDIAQPKEVDIDVALLELLASAKTGNGKEYALDLTSREIGPGDIVYIYYRGYILDDAGNEVALDGMSNFSDASPYALTIGSGSFVPGFEFDMVGHMTSDYTKLEKVTLGGLKNNEELAYAYVSYTRTENADATKTVSVKNERIDLHSDDVALKYGEGFKEWVDMAPIAAEKGADFVTAIDGKEYTYTNAKINFATKSEGGESRLVECYFPYNYGKAELNNETAYFEVYVEKFFDYDVYDIVAGENSTVEPTLISEANDAFIKRMIEEKKIKISEDVLNTYEGDTLVAKYRDYLNKQYMDTYNTEYETLLQSAILEHLRNIAKVKKYPAAKVDELYEQYYKTVNDSYIDNEGYINSTKYSSLSTYAVAYFGLSSGADWTAHIRGLSQDAVKERLILYYLARYENIAPTNKAEFAKEVENTKQKLLDEYVIQYLSYEGKTKEDYKDDYDAFVAERLKDLTDYYTAAYFEESTYYNLLMEEAKKWVTITTMDDNRSVPQTK